MFAGIDDYFNYGSIGYKMKTCLVASKKREKGLDMKVDFHMLSSMVVVV